jgi:oxygen-dependent protoporphyrinogen oxidase
VRTGAPVAALERRADRWLVELDGDGGSLDADAVVLTTPAFAAAPLLAPHSPAAAERLGAIRYASVTLVSLAYDEPATPLPGSGFLVPRTEGRLLTACSVFSNKWPHLAAPVQDILRSSVVRHGHERWRDLDDEALTEAVHDELVAAYGLSSAPRQVRVSRWERSFPQYPAGHLPAMAEVERTLRDDAPGIVVSGAYLKGVGIPTCIGAATAAVDALTA